MKRIGATICATAAICLFSGSLVLAQGLGGYPPGVNPSNPQDMTHRANPQDLTLPGASNPQDLVRSPTLPSRLSPGLARDFAASPPLSQSLGRTYTVGPKRRLPRHKHGVTGPES
jgi:hypothetical protein